MGVNSANQELSIYQQPKPGRNSSPRPHKIAPTQVIPRVQSGRMPEAPASYTAPERRGSRVLGAISFFAIAGVSGILVYGGMQLRSNTEDLAQPSSEEPAAEQPVIIGTTAPAQTPTPAETVTTLAATTVPTPAETPTTTAAPTQGEAGIVYLDPNNPDAWQVSCSGSMKQVILNPNDDIFDITELAEKTGEAWNQGAPPPNNPDTILWELVQGTRQDNPDGTYTVTVGTNCEGLAEY